MPFAAGAETTLANLALRCATHNAYAADADFGAERMDRAIAHSRDQRARADQSQLSLLE